jgi:hypothetical protein
MGHTTNEQPLTTSDLMSKLLPEVFKEMQAYGSYLLVTMEKAEYDSPIVRPDTIDKSPMYLIFSVGPEVKGGLEVGDRIAAREIRMQEIGRHRLLLIKEDAVNVLRRKKYGKFKGGASAKEAEVFEGMEAYGPNLLCVKEDLKSNSKIVTVDPKKYNTILRVVVLGPDVKGAIKVGDRIGCRENNEVVMGTHSFFAVKEENVTCIRPAEAGELHV